METSRTVGDAGSLALTLILAKQGGCWTAAWFGQWPTRWASVVVGIPADSSE